MFDEKDILRRCLKNERKAQKILFEQFAPSMLGVCMRYAGSKPEAEDILQEGFVKVFTYLKNFEGRSSLAAWIRRIMINTAITLYHKNLKHQHHYDIDEVKETRMDNVDLQDTEFTREELLGIIKSLPTGYNMVFNLYAVEGYKHKEIGEMLGIDENTSKSQYSRAKKLIQTRLELLAVEKTEKQSDPGKTQ